RRGAGGGSARGRLRRSAGWRRRGAGRGRGGRVEEWRSGGVEEWDGVVGKCSPSFPPLFLSSSLPRGLAFERRACDAWHSVPIRLPMRLRFVLPLLACVPALLLAYTPAPADLGAEAGRADTTRHANLQVFPEDIEHEQLMAAMRAFRRALGVRCTHCHVRG